MKKLMGILVIISLVIGCKTLEGSMAYDDDDYSRKSSFSTDDDDFNTRKTYGTSSTASGTSGTSGSTSATASASDSSSTGTSNRAPNVAGETDSTGSSSASSATGSSTDASGTSSSSETAGTSTASSGAPSSSGASSQTSGTSGTSSTTSGSSGTQPAQSGTSDAPRVVSSIVKDVKGKEWKLIEVIVNNRNTNFDRRTLVREGFGDIFMLNIDEQNVFGVGAPNQFSAPYTASGQDGLQVKVEVVRSTLMAAIYHPEKLKERDFFIYIQNTYKWEISGGNLVLNSKNERGAEVVMTFSL